MRNYLIATLVICFVFVTSCAQDKTIDESDLPNEIRTFIATHFPNNPVVKAKLDEDDGEKKYEVKLKENIELDFNANNEITNIDGNSELPASVIPNKIMEYVKANYADNVITDWELDGSSQEIELDNGVNLEFTMDGDFIKID